MRILKVYETEVNLSATEQYQPDMNAVIIDKLRQTFEGTCFHSSLIIKIIRIVQRSHCTPAQNLADGSGCVAVIFEAEAIIYNIGDIVTDCVVQNMAGRGGLICKSDYAAIHIKGTLLLRGIQIGQILPITGHEVTYSKNKTKISINAKPYYHPMDFKLCLTSLEKYNLEDIEVLQTLLDQVNEAFEISCDIEKSVKVLIKP